MNGGGHGYVALSADYFHYCGARTSENLQQPAMKIMCS